MNKFIAFSIGAVTFLNASSAFAQAYYYPVSGTGCVGLSSTLTIGSSGSQVLSLQKFLIAQNYPGGGSWMETGTFGQATAAAVRNFQQLNGLPETGVVDSSTMNAINSVSCGSSSSGAYGNSYLPGLGGNGYSYNNSNYPYANNFYTSPYNYYSNQYPYSYPYSYNNYNPYNGYNQYNQYNPYPYNYNYINCNSYPYYGYGYNNYNCTSGQAPTLTSLAPQNAYPGQTLTVYGTNFNYSNNTVYVGGTTVNGIASYGGTSLTFTLPNNVSNGLVSISVGNTWGTSNALTLEVGNGNTYPCQGYPYTYGYNNYNSYNNYDCYPNPYPNPYPYPQGYCPPGVTPTLSTLNPTSGAVGTTVTLFGSCFSSTGNSVRFGNGIIANLNSTDGSSLSFVIPSTLSGYGYQPIGLGTYNISVSNMSGVSSNSLPFTITSLGNAGAPTIGNVSGPTSIATGQTGTWSLTVNTNGGTYSSVSVNWGDAGNGYVNMAAPQTVYGTQALTFTHAYTVAGSYTITFTAANQYGQQSSATATISVGGSNSGSVPTLSYLTPNSGNIGTQVTIYGYNFSVGSNNTVNFGAGVIQNAYSNGSSLTFTVPPNFTPACAYTYPVCPFAYLPVSPGTYNVTVNDPWGTSNTLQFTVY